MLCYQTACAQLFRNWGNGFGKTFNFSKPQFFMRLMIRTTLKVTAKIKWNILCNEFRVVTSTQHTLAYYYYYYSYEVFFILTVQRNADL